MAVQIQLRRGTASLWTSTNPTLSSGEFGYETDTGNLKVGDGSTAWTSLEYWNPSSLPIGDLSGVTISSASSGHILKYNGSAWVNVAIDDALAGLTWHEAVHFSTAAALPNSPTYSNGTSGVGATLTSDSQVRLQVDGQNVTTGNRVLVQDQSSAVQNGVYTVTNQGASGSAAWVLTRATDFDGSATGRVEPGEAVYTLSGGSTNSGQGFVVTSTSNPHQIGSDSITFTQFTGTSAFTAGTDLSFSGNTINHDASGASAGSYGSATQVPGYTIDAQGHITTASNTTIAIPSTAVTDFTEAVQDVSGAQIVTNGSHTGLTAAYDDANDGAIDLTVAATLGTHTSGNYVATITGTSNEVEVSGSGAESATVTVGLPDDVTIGNDLTVTADVSAVNASLTGNLTATSTDAGSAAAPVIDLVRDSASPAAADYLGQIKFTGDDAGGASHAYAKITGKIDDPTAGAEDGLIEFAVVSAGSNEIVARIKTDGLFLNTGNTVRFEGATADGNETTLTVADPTADRTFTLPDATGTALTTGNLTDITNIGTLTGDIVFEGSTADGNETTLTVTDPTADRTITLPNSTGTVALTSDFSTTSIEDADGDTKIQVEESSDEDIIRFDTGGSERMTIAADGTVTITGNLTVSGTTTEISSTTITVDDKNIELGSVASPDDTTADGGGLTLKGAADYTIAWTNSKDAWEYNQNINLNPITPGGQTAYYDGGFELGRIPIGTTDYIGMKTKDMNSASSSEYIIATSGTNTYIGTGASSWIGLYSGSNTLTAKIDASGGSLGYAGSKTWGRWTVHATGSTKTADHTAALVDESSYIWMNVGSANTFTVPPNSSVAFDNGTMMTIINYGAGQTTIAAGSGVTLRYSPGLKLRAQYSVATIVKYTTDEWLVYGDIVA